jgi:mono/diheme cytochrome c family protein
MPSRKMLAVILTVVVAGFVSALIVLSLYGGVDDYTPATDDAAVIFREACARCHGEGGAGGVGIGPRLAGQGEAPEEVVEQIVEGKGRMPRFPNIRGRALDNLAAYVQGL